MGANLDRFSTPMPSELKCYQSEILEVEEVEEVVECAGCGCELDLDEEDYVESEFWEDEYMHDLKECIQAYYQKESDLNRQNKSQSA